MHTFLLSIDFGLVVLIWIVQLIIYPGFNYYDRAGLRKWHAKYTVMITIIVLPLMVGQVVLHGLRLLEQVHVYGMIQAAMITCVWGITFLKAVPLHARIDRDEQVSRVIIQLVRWNWPRTILWSSVFIIHFIQKCDSYIVELFCPVNIHHVTG